MITKAILLRGYLKKLVLNLENVEFANLFDFTKYFENVCTVYALFFLKPAVHRQHFDATL